MSIPHLSTLQPAHLPAISMLLAEHQKKNPNPQPNHPKPKHPKHYNTRVKKASYPIFQTQACLWIFLLQVNLCMFFSGVSRIKPKVCIAILFSMVCRKLYVRETFVYMQVPVWQRYMHITQLWYSRRQLALGWLPLIQRAHLIGTRTANICPVFWKYH